jgi:hypothetical protein
MTRFFSMTHRLLLGTAVFAALLPAAAVAQDCNALLSVAVNPAAPAAVNDIRTVTLTMGAGGIVGGTQLTLSQIRYDLDCDADFPVTIPCVDQGDIFNYEGDVTITTTCGTCAGGDLNAGDSCAPAGPGGGCDALLGGDNLGTCVAVTWTSNVPAGGNATNEIVFTPSTPIVIDANTFPYCEIAFDVALDNLQPTMGAASDPTTSVIEVVAGFSGGDATCDNALTDDLSEPAFITLAPAPTCGDGNVDPGETCDPPASIPLLPPGNLNECRLDCTYCGDGILTPPETCDTGGVPNRSCNPNCTGRIARDPASIVFNVRRTTIDRLSVNGLILPVVPINPSTSPLGVRLSNANGLIYSLELPAGAMVTSGRAYKFRNRHAKVNGGFSEFTFRPHRDGYRIKLATYGDLSAATLAQMTVEVYFGGQQFVHSAVWDQTKRGWRDSGHTEYNP